MTETGKKKKKYKRQKGGHVLKKFKKASTSGCREKAQLVGMEGEKREDLKWSLRVHRSTKVNEQRDSLQEAG